MSEAAELRQRPEDQKMRFGRSDPDPIGDATIPLQALRSHARVHAHAHASQQLSE